MNSERLAQHPGTEKVPEAVRDEVGIVAAAFPARDRHGEEAKGGGRGTERQRRGPRRGGADGTRHRNIAPAEAVRPHWAAEAAAAARLDTVENCGDGGERPNAQVLRFPRGQNVGGICR